MRYAAKVDRNQADIVRALRQVGAEVTPTHTLGHGFPDLVAGFRGVTYLLEVKMPGEHLTEDEERWHRRWSGQVSIVYSEEDALRAIGAMN